MRPASLDRSSRDSTADTVGRNSVPHIIRSGQKYDHFRIDVVQLAVFEPPEYVLNAIGAPAEIRRIPAEEVRFPVLK